MLVRVVTVAITALATFAACSSDEAADPGSDDGGAAGSSSGAASTSGGNASSGANGASSGAPDRDGSVVGTNDSSTGNDGSYVGQHGALHVVGNEIHDAQDAPIQLRGMSLFWSQWASPFWNPTIVHTVATDWHGTLVRAAVAVESGGYLTEPDIETARATTIADAALAEGIYVVLDWHDDHADQHVEQAKTFFGAMATRYANVPNVIFEVWNEPNGSIPWTTVKTYAETVTQTIRATGANNLVIVGSPNWSSDADVAADNPVQDTNSAYTFHFYAASHKQSYRDKAAAALNKGVALFVTEWGTCESSGSGTVDTVESKTWLDFLDAHHVSWANWSLFDKAESCAALVPGASVTGPWPADALSASGTFVHGQLAP